METPIGGADCSQCEWEGNECKKFEPSLNAKVKCPVNCYLPYPDNYYTGDVPRVTDSMMSDPTTVEAQRFINFHIKDENVNPTPGDINTEFRCGTSTLPENATLPSVPTRNMFYSLFSDDKYSTYYNGPIKWDKIVHTDLLQRIIVDPSNMITIDNFRNKIDVDGVELEWYNNSNLVNISDYNDFNRTENIDAKPDYQATTQVFKENIFDSLIRNGINQSQYGFLIDNVDNESKIPINSLMVRRTRNEQLEYLSSFQENDDSENLKKENTLSTDGSDEISHDNIDYENITKFLHFFTLNQEDNNNKELEIDLNKLLNTDENDDEYINRIKRYRSFEDLGRNYEDLKYVERKIRKFLGTNNEDYINLFVDRINYDTICNQGFSTKPFNILLHLLELKQSGNVNAEELANRKRALKIIYKYIPKLMKKVIDISERLEKTTCDRVTNKTITYKEMYKDLFVESSVLKFSMPDFGMFDFFDDFSFNIYTKIILLIFITFIFTKIITLFKVNVNT